MDSIARLGFTFSLLLIQSLFPFSISSSPQRHLLQLSSQSPQNLQTFPSTAIPAFINPTPPPPPPLLPPPLPPSAASSPSDSDNGHIAAAVIGTAASSFALYGFLFFAFYRFTKKKRRGLETRVYSSDAAAATAGGDVNTLRSKPEHTIKGVIVDDNGLDVLYWRNLEDTAARRRCDHCNSIVDRGRYIDDDEATESPEPRRRRRGKGGEVMTQGTPLLPSDSVSSSSQVFAQTKAQNRNSSVSIASLELVSHSPPAAPPPPPPPPARPKPPNPPPPPIKMSPAPPPPPARRAAAAPLPQLGSEGGAERPRLKPLHWEKVTPTRAGHSMVWDRINDGSIKFDDDQMEALFGYISTNPNPPKTNSGESSTSTSTVGAGVAVPSPISLLDARKSQNIAIILRTLAASRHEILESLHHGNGLAADTLEKLSRITLTKDEESLIISFSGDPIYLTDADSFLFHLLQTFPSAFPRILAMHFRSCVYNPEILHLKQSLQTLELACKELRTKGLFLKLLEAILKAGNRMNAGTARGNAQAFDLTALRKLSDVKSTDGKTTLLHFVVEEVVRSEGKRCAAINGTLGEERERDFVTLGLPVVGKLSYEFMNVKAAAALDPESMAASCSTMAERVIDIRNFLGRCEEKEEGFFREMMGFVETAGKEMEEVREEQCRVMDIVKRTTAYYQLGAALKEKEGKPSLQIFVIVRDFLAMVDQACVDISRNVQRRKKQTPSEKEKRITARFPNLPARFMADNSISFSDSDEEF